MAEIFLLLLFSVPAIIGLAEIIHALKLLLISPSKTAYRILVIYPDNENFEGQLLHVSERRKWLGDGYADKIVVLSSALCRKNREECNGLASRLGFITADGQELLEDFFKKEEVGGGDTKDR